MKNFFTDIMSKKIREQGHYKQYGLHDIYGQGAIRIVEILDGLRVVESEFLLSDAVINDVEAYLSGFHYVMKIVYTLEGTILNKLTEERVMLTRPESVLYYIGDNIFKSMEPYSKRHRMLTLVGQPEKFSKSLGQWFGICEKRFEQFFQLLEEEGLMVIRFNAATKDLVNSILEAIDHQEFDKVRLRALELLLHEMDNFEKNKQFMAIYHERTTIDKVIAVEAYIREHLDDNISIDGLCQQFDISSASLKSCFKDTYLQTIYAYIKKVRMEAGRCLLEQTDKKVIDIALACGYSNHNSFAKAFKQHYHMTPSECRYIKK